MQINYNKENSAVNHNAGVKAEPTKVDYNMLTYIF